MDIPPELTRLRDVLPSLIEDMERQVPYAAALVQQQTGHTIHVESREQHVEPADPSLGVVLSFWTGRRLAELATSELHPDRLVRLAREFAAGLTVEPDGLPVDPGPPLEQTYATSCQIDPATVPLQEKFAHCVEVQARLAALDPRVINARVLYRDEAETKLFVNRSRRLLQRIQRARLMMMLLVHENGRTVYDWRIQDGTRGYEVAAVTDETLASLRDSALALLSAERIEPGFYDCVSCPDVSGIIAHEAFGHGVELDMFLKGRARARDYLGKQVASPLVTMVDNPLAEGGYGGFFFDDEGEPARPITIIREGILERGLGDLASSLYLGVERTASGRRESFARKPYARMSNTYILPGHSTPEEMVASVPRGIYLEHGSSGMEDPKDWGIQVICHYGREIVNGRVTGRVFAPVGITGYVPDLLQSISMVGNDLKLSGGYCGKGYKELVPNGSGGPHLKFRARLG
ncbi:MAG: TldD/PmbA family protein [Anaerolineae bacterium]|nr:TldD/PmbA family protein [Anaerolineae bacterium]